jgi:8-oxo-dGTP pyrophosphatase MutT (NUDIX family)
VSPLADRAESWPVASSEVVFSGGLVEVRLDRLADGEETFARDVVVHPGAAAVVAIDADERVLVVTQYRHAVGERLVEIPAGLLDVDGESPLEAAKRELREEGLVEASSWRPLLTLIPQPGVSTERVHIFVAEGITESSAPDGFEAEHEEAGMTREWVPLAELVDAVLAGRISNATTVAGSLAAWHLRHGMSRQ